MDAGDSEGRRILASHLAEDRQRSISTATRHIEEAQAVSAVALGEQPPLRAEGQAGATEPAADPATIGQVLGKDRRILATRADEPGPIILR